MKLKLAAWKLGIDTGGTFTDCIAVDPAGTVHRIKVLSSGCLRGRIVRKINLHVYQFEANWQYEPRLLEGYRFRIQGSDKESRLLAVNYQDKTLVTEDNLMPVNDRDFEISTGEEAPVLAARLVTGTSLHAELPEMEVRLGTTKGTNALLERKGARTLLIVTRGFKDLLRIGTQQRPHLFQLNIPEPEVLYDAVIEVDERIDARGEIQAPLYPDRVRIAGEFESVAISLLHACRNPEHEQQLHRHLENAGYRFVSAGTELSNAMHYLRRTRTVVMNAYLAPVLDHYLSRIRAVTGRNQVKVMTSRGSLVNAAGFYAKDSLLSGPAGGVIAARRLASEFGFRRVLTFDMGGTSTDAARIDERPELQYITTVDGVELHSASLAIETVAAGGGSVCWFDGFKLCVGPESAGATPGPACYGAGGPFTITDVNLLLGKLDPARFGIPVHRDEAERALKELQQRILLKTGNLLTEEQLLEGFEAIANEKMADAIRRISVAKGIAPSDYLLLTYGGAGGLHGCRLAEILGVTTVMIPRDAGLFSARGIGDALASALVSRQVLRPWNEIEPLLPDLWNALEEEGKAQLLREGIHDPEIEFRSVFLRFGGQESTLEIPFSEQGTMRRFEEVYRSHFRYFPPDGVIELESIRLGLAETGPEAKSYEIYREEHPLSNGDLAGYLVGSPGGGKSGTPVYDQDRLTPGIGLTGPAVVSGRMASAYIPEGWKAVVQETGDLILFRITNEAVAAVESPEAVELELITNRFTAIAEEMGVQLQRTAFSVNVKERLDFSCALLDAEGELLVNAPHIPVHLGSLGVCARLVKDFLPVGPGDVVITNHPEFGGSHLPDVTLLAGVFQGNTLLGYVINRAHHAEIGGMTPGSMPANAVRLQEEGAVIRPCYLVKNGEFQQESLRKLLLAGPYPSRTPHVNEADVLAALSALRRGQDQLLEMAGKYGITKTTRYMQLLKERAATELQAALAPFEGKVLSATEYLDDGYRINVRIAVKRATVRFDFTGTSRVHPHNLNANAAILNSAVLYVLRLLVNKEIPLNEGLLQRVQLVLPHDSFLHPDFKNGKSPAVVGGNTEVSQRLVDTLLKAFGMAACSQGTMNNFLFGNKYFGYYETIGGGAGAGEGFHGRSGVHQHMTNTRITDAEELERRYPVRLLEFRIRDRSGGSGKFRGGDGLVRTIEFLEAMSVTLLTQHRHFRPFGMAGGRGGQTGSNMLRTAEGRWIQLPGIVSMEVKPLDRIVIETPGGGGFGEEEAVRTPASGTESIP